MVNVRCSEHVKDDYFVMVCNKTEERDFDRVILEYETLGYINLGEIIDSDNKIIILKQE
ncbi:MAG: hypothetical protein SOZ48_06935 [Eubacterium sp.]|nr:hypothetical protein [Eubacterium sp.]